MLGVAEVVALAEVEDELTEVGVGVMVRTTGTTVAIGITVFPDRIVVEMVADVVSRIRD